MATHQERAGKAIRRRRERLRLTQQEAAAVAGVGTTTLREFELGRFGNYRPSTLIAIAGALKWPADAIETMLDGGPEPRHRR